MIYQQNQIKKRIRFAQKLLLAAGRKLRRTFHKSKAIETFQKEHNETVTQLDLWVDQFLMKKLLKSFKDGWISEESPKIESPSGYTWILDPIDGTNNFCERIPFFCISLALYYHDEAVAGFVFDPIHKVFYSAHDERSFVQKRFTKKEKLKYKSLLLSESLLGYSIRNKDSLCFDIEVQKEWSLLIEKSKATRRLGSAALEIIYVGTGQSAFYWIESYRIWDVAAALLFAKNNGMKSLEILETGILLVYNPSIEQYLAPFITILTEKGKKNS